MPPPLPPGVAVSPAVRAWKRAVAFARSSAIVLVVLAGLSTFLNIQHPLSLHFLISILALGTGLAEWRLARALAERQPSATSWLAWNQVILGAGILAYGLLQARAMTPERAWSLLAHPQFQPLLQLYSPEQLEVLRELLPPLLRLGYYAAGIGGALGCWVVAWYYRSRRRHVVAAAAEVEP